MGEQRRVVMDSLDEAMQHHFDGASRSPEDFNILITGFGVRASLSVSPPVPSSRVESHRF